MKLKQKLVVSDCGAVVAEPLARRLDELKKELPAECTFRRKGSLAVPIESVDGGTRTEVSTITSAAVDRDGEIVDPTGVVLDDYRANPIVLFGHNDSQPVGKCLWVKATAKDVMAKTQYPERPANYEGDWLPDYVFAMIHAEVLKGKSIGFLPLDLREPSDEEREKGAKLVITKSLLCELSVVAVPCNPEALVSVIAKGIDPAPLGVTWRPVGKVKQKKPTPLDLARYRFDPEAVAAEVMARLYDRWGV